MKLRYTVCDPTKNITMLVETPVARDLHMTVASGLMERFPDVEQVGFFEPAHAPGAVLRLQMMGGEFCGNAAMSAAAAWADELGCTDSVALTMEVSGGKAPVSCRLEPAGDGWQGTVEMPPPEAISTIHVPDFGAAEAVFFPGIVHCIVPAGAMPPPLCERVAPALCSAMMADACGILRYNDAEGSFVPLVYVAATRSAVWESGCGSGTAAMGCLFASQTERDIACSLRQPGGVMSVRAAWRDGAVSALSISGHVQVLRRGKIDLPL